MTIVALVATTVLAGHAVEAQVVDPGPSQPLASLKTVSVPEPDNLGDFVKDKVAAIALGKTLFWDMQVGSDGIQSCASCHFHAGADNRSKNQVNPGGRAGDTIFNIGGGPNYTLKPGDYPFHKLADPGNRSSVVSDSNDITGSQGVFKADFNDIVIGSDKDNVTPKTDEIFNVNNINVRQVTDRNTPSAINAVFNFRNFWDGRAQNIFNGVNPFGLRDPNAFILKANGLNRLRQVKIQLKNSSLASQAVGPPTSSVEQSGGGRQLRPLSIPTTLDSGFPADQIGSNVVAAANNTANRANTPEQADTSDQVTINAISEAGLGEGASIDQQFETLTPLFDNRRIGKLTPKKIGKKMLSLKPLGKQLVAKDDSVLGSYSAAPANGLNTSYESLIQTAFKPEWWNSDLVISFDDQNNASIIRRPNGPLTTKEVTLMEYNFSLFFGLAIQAYESTLVSDNAPIDQYLEGNTSALSAQQVRGKELFEGRAKCINCHGGAEFTNASVKNVQDERLEFLKAADGGQPVYDNGFYNIGVRPTLEDLGVGDKDPFKNPLSESGLAQIGKFQELLGENPNINVSPSQNLDVDGSFKAPGLRNVELTAPYFHNGGQLTLEQVVEFYNRGSDFRDQNKANVPEDIQNLNLSATEKADLVAFLKALTDERVRSEKAPFDHPQLFIPNGHPGDQNAVTNDSTVQTNDGTRQATDIAPLLEIPAVGRNGGSGTPNFLAARPVRPIPKPKPVPCRPILEPDRSSLELDSRSPICPQV